jgi:hypothetical protein
MGMKWGQRKPEPIVVRRVHGTPQEYKDFKSGKISEEEYGAGIKRAMDERRKRWDSDPKFREFMTGEKPKRNAMKFTRAMDKAKSTLWRSTSPAQKRRTFVRVVASTGMGVGIGGIAASASMNPLFGVAIGTATGMVNNEILKYKWRNLP